MAWRTTGGRLQIAGGEARLWQSMKLRFEVDQAEVTIAVSRSRITDEQRKLLAAHLDGADVLKLHFNPTGRKLEKTYYWTGPSDRGGKRLPVRIHAKEPTFFSLLRAIKANQAEATREQHHPPGIALSVIVSAYVFMTAEQLEAWQWISMFS